MRFEFLALILLEIFYFSEGKPCPEKTRPHKTRCEAFYKCTELPSKRLVWIPEKCESGLVYEHNLGLCVLPDDDWECTLGISVPGEKIKEEIKATNEDVINKIQNMRETPTTPINKTKDSYSFIITNKNHNKTVTVNEIEVIADGTISGEEEVDRDENQIESSGDGGGELVELDGFLQAENRETEDSQEKQQTEEGANVFQPETVTRKSKIDPKLTAQLQRLSQLIDGLKDQYQQDDKEQMDLRPDQLNAFLAHFNIQNKFNLIKPTFDTISNELPRITTTTTTTTTELPESTTTDNVKYELLHGNNDTHIEEHLDNKLNPETKVVLTNGLPQYYPGYSNSQIFVNRPEGSVLFAVPQYGNTDQVSEYGHNIPKISEDTLKTVLELSKQMIATQNIPKIIPNAGYYAQPLIQPLFVPASAFQPQAQTNPFPTYFNSNNNGQQQEDYAESGNKFNPFIASFSTLSGHNQFIRPTGNYNKHGNTIIHNNVIPVHVSATNSGEKEIVDSYGQSLGVYPPLHQDFSGNAYHQNYQLGDNKFLPTPTTARPQISTTSFQHSSFSTDLGATTTHPTDYQPTPPTLTEYFSPSPHLDENNVNKLFQPTDRYPTVQYDDLPRPIGLGRPSLFSPQTSVNNIRPNGHKIESMEIEADEYNDNHARPMSQLFSYNYNNDKTDTSNQYQEPSYNFGTSSSNNNNNKNAYMPRPSHFVGGSTRPTYTNNVNKFKPHNTHSSSAFADGTQLVNVGGNFVSFDVFQNTILPLLGPSQSLNNLNNVEVITCTTGVRQPNTTDCTRYYVCSKKDGKVLSYSCPPYTAFNAQTRICDAHTYAVCSPDAIMSSYTVTANKRLQMEAIKMLQDAKRRQDQAIKSQNIANLIQKYETQSPDTSAGDEQDNESDDRDMLNTYVQQAAAMNIHNTTPKPTVATTVKKRKYYCKEGDKIADQTSINNYFVCYKNAQGMMKGHKLTCTKGLIFCAKNSLCTLSSKCT